MPYFKSKLHSIYNKEREARLQASLWGHVDERFDDADIFDRGEDSVIPRGNLDMEASVRMRLTKKIQKFIGACYPLLHASTEGVCIFLADLYMQRITFIFRFGFCF